MLYNIEETYQKVKNPALQERIAGYIISIEQADKKFRNDIETYIRNNAYPQVSPRKP